MELADVTDSKSVGGNIVWVRVPPPAPVESLDAQYACGAFFFAYASVLAPKRHLFCLRQTPGRARSRYALQVFSFAGCTSRVLTGIFFVYDRQRDAGLHSFWVQRHFYFSITIEGVSISFAKHSVIFLYVTRYQAISRIISRISISPPYRSVLFPFAVWCTWGEQGQHRRFSPKMEYGNPILFGRFHHTSVQE